MLKVSSRPTLLNILNTVMTILEVVFLNDWSWLLLKVFCKI